MEIEEKNSKEIPNEIPVEEDEHSSLKWLVLATVMVGTFLGRLDQTIVNLALPKIIGDFGITVSAAGWIATAYILANAIFVPIWGKLGDTIGRKRVYILGFVIFIIGSVLAGLAWNLPSLIVFRVIQAIAGSADYPTAMAILAVTFKQGKERAQALGIWSSSFAAGAVFGPLIGGPLIDNFGWRSVFLMNLPVGIVGLGMALAYVKESVSGVVNSKFDWWGALTLGGALAGLVLALDQGSDWGWVSAPLLLIYLAIIICSTLFIWIEKRHPEPIIDLKFFSNPLFVNTLLNNFVVFMGLIGSIFLVPLFAQNFLGYNATESGYLFIPMAVALMIGAPLGGSLTGKVAPRYVIAASTAVAGIGLFLFTRVDPRSTAFDLILPLIIMAFGLGFGMAQRTSVIASAVPQNEIGVASSILALVRNIAGAFGIAIFGTILINATKNNVINIAQQSSFHFQNIAQTQTGMALIILKADIYAYREVFLISSIIVLVGSALALLITADKASMKANKDVEVFAE